MTTALQYRPRPSLVPKKQSRTDMAYSAIKAEINAGNIPPDSFINIPEIERQLGMSRTPVREAMLRLQSEKVVEIIPKRGIRLLSLEIADLADYYQVVMALELQAISNMAARGLSRAEVMPLFYALTAEETALRAGDAAAWQEADEKFHRALFILNGNKKLQEAGISHRDIMQRAHFSAMRHLEQRDRERCMRAHNEVKEIILSGRGPAARDFFRDHEEWLRETVIEALTAAGITRL